MKYKQVICKGISFGDGIPKICVSIIENNREKIIQKGMSLKGKPVDLIEWRCDYFEFIHQAQETFEVLKQLKEIHNDIPLLFTFRTINEGGTREFSKQDYIRINQSVIESGLADFIDIEINTGEAEVRDLIARAHKKGCKVITSYHDFQKTHTKQEIIDILCFMQECGADITKAAMMPQTEMDVLILLEATLEMKITYADRPFITISMAGSGLISRLSGEIFGSAVTFGCMGKSSAPGQIEAEDLSRILEKIHSAL